MKRLLSISAYVVLFTALIALLGFIRKEYGNVACKTMRIVIEYNHSDTLVSVSDIERLLLLKKDTLEGRKLSPGDLGFIRETIMDIPYIAYCDVDFLLNGTLRIRAKQRIPMIRIVTGNQSWYIDTEGTVMPRHHRHSARVPVAGGHLGSLDFLKTGNNLFSLADTSMSFAARPVHALLQVAHYIHNHVQLRDMVEQLYINAHGETELFTKVGSQRILFGDAENIEEKFFKLLAYYQAGPAYNGIGQYRTINLKYNNQVVCSKQ